MTLIVAVKDKNGHVYVGGDSVGSLDNFRIVRSDPKVFMKGPYVIGYTHSFRMGQIIRFSATLPAPSGDPDKHMFKLAKIFSDTFSKEHFATEYYNVRTGGRFIIGWKGHLYIIEPDFQFGRSPYGYLAAGSAFEVAYGALHTTQDLKPLERINMALSAGTEFNNGVGPPFIVCSTKDVKQKK